MIVIPAVDLMDGKCVQLVEGRPWLARVSIEDVVGTALRWEEMGAKRLHVIDLDAALGNGDNFSVTEKILSEVSIPVQVGGGIRDDEIAERLLSSGASQIIAGTRAITDIDWLRSLSGRYPDRLIAAVDARGSEISIKGWTDGSRLNLFDYVRATEDLDIFGYLYTNISREGKLGGIDLDPITDLVRATQKRLLVAGGIASIADIEKLQEAGAFGAVLGMSIYTGKINLKEALERYK